jgi:hypothetical protein
MVNPSDAAVSSGIGLHTAFVTHPKSQAVIRMPQLPLTHLFSAAFPARDDKRLIFV